MLRLGMRSCGRKSSTWVCQNKIDGVAGIASLEVFLLIVIGESGCR